MIVIAVLYFFSSNPLHIHWWSPAEKAIEDFDFTDLVFANTDISYSRPDTQITVVNIGNIDRKKIDSLLIRINSLKPNAIGLDVLFIGPKDTATDEHLRHTIAAIPLLTVAYALTEQEKVPNTQLFLQNAAHKGYVNFNAASNSVVRYFSPFNGSNNTDTSFSAAILYTGYPDKFKYLVDFAKRRKEIMINYKRDLSRYTTLNYEQAMRGDSATAAVPGHIVLIGYYSTDTNNIEDKHITPANKVILGKSLPDMHGIIINANILSMMLDEHYIITLPEWANLLVTTLIIFLFINCIMMRFLKEHLWFHIIVRLIEICSVVLLATIVILLFMKFRIKIDLSLAIWAVPLSTEVFYCYEAVEKGWERRREKRLHTVKKK